MENAREACALRRCLQRASTVVRARCGKGGVAWVRMRLADRRGSRSQHLR